MDARQTARQAMNLLTQELRMVSDGGVVAASADSITIRVPYAFGMVCNISGGTRVASLLPMDSTVFTDALPAGVGYRSGASYAFTSAAITVASSTDTAACRSDSVRTQTGGRLVSISPQSATSAAAVGDLMYLYETVTYKFATSALLPGRRALWRRVSGGAAEEMLTPFAATARFAFLTGTRLTLTTTVPSPLTNLRGVELRLIAESETTPTGQASPSEYDLRPRVRFGNYAN